MNQSKNKRDPDGTRRRILAAAVEEFSGAGLSGARVDQIARRANTNERMLYYYFGSKEQLFIAVLEQAYGAFVEAERRLDVEGLSPTEAIACVTRFLWNYFHAHQDLLRLLNNENLHEARYLKQSERVQELISPFLAALEGILERGRASGEFRVDIDPLRLYAAMCGTAYFVLSNRYTLEATSGRDFSSTEERRAMTELGIQMLLAYLADGGLSHRPSRAD